MSLRSRRHVTRCRNVVMPTFRPRFINVLNTLGSQHPCTPLFDYVTRLNYKLTTKGRHDSKKIFFIKPLKFRKNYGELFFFAGEIHGRILVVTVS